MKNFESGIGWYTKAFAMVEVNFPEDDVCCANCRFYDKYPNRCRLDEYVIIAHPTKCVGGGCPLVPIEEKEENDERQHENIQRCSESTKYGD